MIAWIHHFSSTERLYDNHEHGGTIHSRAASWKKANACTIPIHMTTEYWLSAEHHLNCLLNATKLLTPNHSYQIEHSILDHQTWLPPCWAVWQDNSNFSALTNDFWKHSITSPQATCYSFKATTKFSSWKCPRCFSPFDDNTDFLLY